MLSSGHSILDRARERSSDEENKSETRVQGRQLAAAQSCKDGGKGQWILPTTLALRG